MQWADVSRGLISNSIITRYLYWAVEGGKSILRSHMDGTVHRASTNFSFVVRTVAVDQDDGLLYFAGKGSSHYLGQSRPTPDNRISYCDFESNTHSRLIQLSDMPEQIKAMDSYVFWSSWSASENTWSIFSCEKKSGNGLEQHASGAIAPWGRIVHFDILSRNPQSSNICSGSLCSHICIPTVARYMRCACPMGFKLRSDGWNCGTLFTKVFHLPSLVI